ncbi:MAG: hypothetical protein N2314_03865 [Brevinematales bacterium]|nr:hypothetical protein [Brevinematales bacterium]
MSSFLISLVIFGFSVYLFVITMKRIKQLEDGALDARLKKEMESLIVEFNAAATRNISLLEEKIEELQKLIQKANQKIVQLDEKIERAQKPIVIEKIVEKPSSFAQEERVLSKPSSALSQESTVEKKKVSSLSRQEQLKYWIREGKTREELLAMGFFENEINLVEFLYRNEIKS